MPNYSKWDNSAITEELKKKGSQIGSFNQTTYQEKVGQHAVTGGVEIQASVAGQSLGSGYCAGVCLDWARRVLLSPLTRNQNFLTYGYDAMMGGKGTQEGRSLQDSKERAFQSVGRMGHAWVAHNDMGWTTTSGETSAVSTSEWSGKASGLDTVQAKKKKFSTLVLITSKNSVYDSGDAWMTELMANGFRTGAVSKVGFGRVGKGGHAVAVWQRRGTRTSPDSFYFFDPNYGVFSFNEEGLRAAFKVLFYRTIFHTPAYESCASVKAQRMNYLIFGPPNPVDLSPSSSPVSVPKSSSTSSGTSSTAPKSTPTSSGPPLPTSSKSSGSPSTSVPKSTPTSSGTSNTGVPNPTPTNGYSTPSHGLTSPGKSAPILPTKDPGDSPLKAQMKLELGDTKRHMDTFGSHPKYQGGYVKISHKLKSLFDKDPPTPTKVIVASGGDFAIAKAHMEQVIDML